MTSSDDTQKPKKPILKEINNVTRLVEDSDDPHFALFMEWLQVLEERAEEFDLNYLGILGAVRLLDNEITQELNDE